MLQAPDGPIRVCSTHVSGNACLADVGKTLAARRNEQPFVLMGDLNSTPDVPALRSLIDRLGFVDASTRRTRMTRGSRSISRCTSLRAWRGGASTTSSS